ncbi:MFS transporter [Glycomyces sp. TRM65418]|uniref:MFS transporter n=1 Tax=Glycomyces sp. TRM65418 TaxID=2867006 RepID=UPI001CE523F8|nr:MFS transporter [Glycomyces sp. TRM65418]MCC3763422.1 MFS transporter [Glycomyces sp. TRM65418]QZD57413.1 MFS transporter [Glycomyces sp. TRM65418]
MPPLDRARTDPYRLYLAMRVGLSFMVGMAFTTSVVYRIEEGGLDPFQLLMIGTVLEATYLLFQLPTGFLADLVSRRACVVAGFGVYAGGLLWQGLTSEFWVHLAAQVLLALGAALWSGALESWVADETRRAEMTPVYLRATQLGFIGGITGSLLSGVLASVALNLPMLVGGALMALGTVALALMMPERHFQRPAKDGRVTTVLRQARTEAGVQVRASRRAARVVPGLVLLLGMTFAFGLWSESYDRLSGAFLLEEIGFPETFGLEPAMWFALISCVVALAGIGLTEWAGRRTARLGSGGIIGMLAGFTVVSLVGVIGYSLSGAFWVAIGFLLLLSAARPLYEPLVNGWLVVRVEPKVRATALSARDMFDSGGQIVGGPVIGAVGSAFSLRAALLTGAAVLVPAILFLFGMERKAKTADRDEPRNEPITAGDRG